MSEHVVLREVLEILEGFYPKDTAQSWDRVGLTTGDPDQPVQRIHYAVDPTLAVVEVARDAEADLLITHHPLLLRGVTSVATTSAKGATVTGLIVADIALYSAHTNADVAWPGVCDALGAACGLTDLRHHPALEAREEARGGTPYLIDAGHYATEYLWLDSVRSRLTDALSELGPRGVSVEHHVSALVTDPWTFTVGALDLDDAR